MQVRSLGQEDPLEKATATHASILAWRITQTEEPGRLQSIGSHRDGHDKQLSTHAHRNLASQKWVYFKVLFWRRKWQPIPVFLPGESHGRRSLVGYSPWGLKESVTTGRLHFTSLQPTHYTDNFPKEFAYSKSKTSHASQVARL